jgi:hypothetical protein
MCCIFSVLSSALLSLLSRTLKTDNLPHGLDSFESAEASVPRQSIY